MRVWIEREVRRRLVQPAHHTVLVVRLTPRRDPSQWVSAWSVATSGVVHEWTDGYGNLAHLSVHAGRHEEVIATVSGEIETDDTHGILPADDGLPPLMFLRETQATRVDDGIRALAAPFGERRDDEGAIAALHALMWSLHETLGGLSGERTGLTTAAEVLKRGAGTACDHAHLFIAACRVLAIPARFVSGFRVDVGTAPGLAAHAWAEAYVEDLGWVAFDPAHAVCATDGYIRLAVAIDYGGAAPLHGIDAEAGEETVTATVRVATESEQEQQQSTSGRQTQRQSPGR